MINTLVKVLKDEDSNIRREVCEMKSGDIKCYKCGMVIGQLPTTIAEDIRRGGGTVLGGIPLMYRFISAPSAPVVEAHFA